MRIAVNALPHVLCSDEAWMQRVGFHAQPVRQGICQRGATTRQGERLAGPICPDTLAKHIVQGNLRDLEAVCKGAMRAVAKAGVFGTPQVTGMTAGTDLETTEHDPGCGPGTRTRRIEEKRGRGHEIAGTVSGWNVLRLIDAVTKMPWAVNVGQMQAHAALWTRALVTQARLHLPGYARLHQGVFEKGFWEGTPRWWLDQPGIRGVVPATTDMAVTADARAHAAAGEAITVGQRVHTVRHGHGRAAWSARLETEGVGSTGLTTADQYGTAEHGRHANRRDFQANPLHAVVVRTWKGRA